MIRNWVKNLCNCIEKLDESSSDKFKLPIVNGEVLNTYKSYGTEEKYEYHLYIGDATVDLDESEYVLLKDSIEIFRDRVNENKVINFLKPFIDANPK